MVISGDNKHIAPYFGKRKEPAKGLNQLGLRNAAEQMFTTLLPGLNNVSRRIRYYSFYCWIISHFYLGRETVVAAGFDPYIRRAEYLLALTNAIDQNIQGIPGIMKASDSIASDEDQFSLDEDYWKNPGGILPQYYGASLDELGLAVRVEGKSRLYNITRATSFISGERLAEEFAVSVDTDGDKFLAAVSSGLVTREELKELQCSFRMAGIVSSERERLLLAEMLVQVDNPQAAEAAGHRRETIRYVLEYLSDGHTRLTAEGFARHMYGLYASVPDTITAWGWCAYWLDDNWQYQLTIIFSDILRYLSGELSPGVEDVVSALADEILAGLGCDGDTSLGSFIDSLHDTECRGETSADAVADLLLRYREAKEWTADAERRYALMGVGYENFFTFVQTVGASLGKTVREFAEETVRDVVYRHYRVSFSKMLQTGIASQKFSLENGRLRFIDLWETSHTAPRIETLRGFLLDLGLVEAGQDADCLTETGVALLDTLTHGDRKT
ncbi:MAG: hypothetical protein K2H94_01005 [Duncaniella sp.]|nr:hypothetical protein [Duncaniella sp.]